MACQTEGRLKGVVQPPVGQGMGTQAPGRREAVEWVQYWRTAGQLKSCGATNNESERGDETADGQGWEAHRWVQGWIDRGGARGWVRRCGGARGVGLRGSQWCWWPRWGNGGGMGPPGVRRLGRLG